MKYPTVFLDRDGTINYEFGYINHPSRIQVIPEAGRAIKKLNDAGILTIVVSNQAGVARGYFTEEVLKETLAKMEKDLWEGYGAKVDKIYYCPHHPHASSEQYKKTCNCRKPAPGMIELAMQENPVDPNFSYMIGDRIGDVEFGKKFNFKTAMVMTGYGLGEFTYQKSAWKTQPDQICDNLEKAVDWVLADLAVKNRSLTKLKTREQLKKLIPELKAAGKKVVFVNGCFDLLHAGHVSYLEDAAMQGDVLILGLNSDASIKKIKGEKRPVCVEEQRVEILSSLSSIDYIMLFDEPSVDGILRDLRPSVHAKGTDYTKEGVPERQTAIECGIETYIAGAPKENATKDIILKIIALNKK